VGDQSFFVLKTFMGNSSSLLKSSNLSAKLRREPLQLEQQKLDVVIKSRANLFNWRGQFTPEFVEYILHAFAQETYHIFDPFSGSGTVLHEAARLGLKATGFEINPSAYAMSKFFSFCNLSTKSRNDLCRTFGQKLHFELSTKSHCVANTLNQAVELFPDCHDKLTFIQQFREQLSCDEETIIFMNMLFLSEKNTHVAISKLMYNSFDHLKKCLLNLPHSDNPIQTYLLDARNAGDSLENTVDLILTSPPYINVFNYHQNYRATVEHFDFDVLRVAHSEFGSNRKNRGNRFKTVIQYCLDMELAIRAFWRALKPQAKMILVVGRESNVRSVPFYNSQLVVELIEKSNGFSDVKILERQFTNKFGLCIREDIIIATKTDELSNLFYGRSIATEHLERSLKIAPNEVRSDIVAAIENYQSITASPLFNPNDIIKHASHSTPRKANCSNRKSES